MGTLLKFILFLIISVVLAQIILSVLGLSLVKISWTSASMFVLAIYGSVLFFYFKVLQKGL